MLNKTAKKTNHAVVITAETAPNFDSGSAAGTPDEGHPGFQLPGVSGYGRSLLRHRKRSRAIEVRF